MRIIVLSADCRAALLVAMLVALSAQSGLRLDPMAAMKQRRAALRACRRGLRRQGEVKQRSFVGLLGL